MINLLRLVFVSAFLCLSGKGIAALNQLPLEFTVTERYFSFTTSFDVESREGFIGAIHRSFFALMPEYHFMDQDENMLAKARMRFWSFGVCFDVTDEQDKPLGTVEELFSFFFAQFKLCAPEGKMLAIADLNFWGTEYTFCNPFDKHIIAIVSRPVFALKSYWTVQIADPNAFTMNKLPPQLFLTVLAFQVDREYWANIKNSSSSTRGIDITSFYPEKSPECQLIQTYKDRLEGYRADLEVIIPSEENYQDVITMTSTLINDQNDDQDELDSYVIKLNLLFDLLDSNTLSIELRSALFHLLRNKLA